MHTFSRMVVSRLILAALCVPTLLGQTPIRQTGARKSNAHQASVQQAKVLGSKDAVEIEVDASDSIVPETRVLTGPDRLVVDFPNAVPGNQLRSQSVNRGEVKDLRFGLFQSKPPVTRLVLDLKTAQSYQVFPNGRTVIIKVISGAAVVDTSAGVNDSPAKRPGLVITNYTTGAERISVSASAKPGLEVSFHDGLLTIKANKANLSEVLYAVQQRTGAEVAIPAGAEQEKVAADLGPGPAQDVLAHLLNGSRFNFLILSAANDPRRLDRVILSPRGEGAGMPLAPVQNNDDAADDDARSAPPAEAQANVVPPTPVEVAPKPRPDTPSVPEEDPPEQ